jgi:hypothetical protein
VRRRPPETAAPTRSRCQRAQDQAAPSSQAHCAQPEAIRSFLAKIAIVAEAARKSRTRKRLEQAWRNVVATRPESGPDPPSG